MEASIISNATYFYTHNFLTLDTHSHCCCHGCWSNYHHGCCNNKLMMLHYYTKEEAVYICIVVIKIGQALMAMIWGSQSAHIKIDWIIQINFSIDLATFTQFIVLLPVTVVTVTCATSPSHTWLTGATLILYDKLCSTTPWIMHQVSLVVNVFSTSPDINTL